MREAADFKKQLILKLLINTEKRRNALLSYLKETQIATRRWLLGEVE
jgi:ribosomal protein S15P/S13E